MVHEPLRAPGFNYLTKYLGRYLVSLTPEPVSSSCLQLFHLLPKKDPPPPPILPISNLQLKVTAGEKCFKVADSYHVAPDGQGAI